MFFSAEAVMPHITRIYSVADTMMYLVEGSERAVLVDTGCGIGDLYEFVRGLTDKPISVLLTHGHVDHALGAWGFDAVYLNPLDRDVYLAHSRREVQRSYASALPAEAWGPFDAPSDDDWRDPLLYEQFRPMYPGDVFELGGISAVITEGAGHTPGCVTILFPELRVLLLGDACNEFTFLFEQYSSSVADYRDMLVRLKKDTDGAYDRVLFLHRSGEGDVNMVSNVIDVCDDILNGRADNIPFESFIGNNGVIAKEMDWQSGRCDGKSGNIVYDPKKLTVKGGSA